MQNKKKVRQWPWFRNFRFTSVALLLRIIQALGEEMAFGVEPLPDADRTVITDAWLVMKNKKALNTKRDIRFTIEIAELKRENQSLKSKQLESDHELIGQCPAIEQLNTQIQKIASTFGENNSLLDTIFFSLFFLCKNGKNVHLCLPQTKQVCWGNFTDP